VSFADGQDLAGHRRRRTIGWAHACHRGKKIRTVIRHARDIGSTRTALALAITVVETTLR
jgi:hypothetical protein